MKNTDQRWTLPEWFPDRYDFERGSRIRFADTEDLDRIGLGHGRCVLVEWK